MSWKGNKLIEEKVAILDEIERKLSEVGENSNLRLILNIIKIAYISESTENNKKEQNAREMIKYMTNLIYGMGVTALREAEEQ